MAEIYSHLPKDYTVTAKGWELLKAKLLGKKYVDRKITAYLYDGKFYITKLGRD